MYNEIELLEWWKSLDLTWKRIFKRALDINHNPSDSELFEIFDLEEIDCSNSQIISLDPLKFLFKLRKLNCSNTNINQLDKISNLILIDELDISKTYVKSLKPISKFNQLWRLKCDHSDLVSLNGVEGLSNLEYINCSDTNIKNIDELIDLPSIKLIECNNLDLNLLYPKGIVNLENKIRLDGIDFIFKNPLSVKLNERDALFEDSARLVVLHQQGSTSLIQRKLKLGYNRAGRIIDQLETFGIVGPFEGSMAREVLIKDEYHLEQHLNTLFNISYSNSLDFNLNTVDKKVVKISSIKKTTKKEVHFINKKKKSSINIQTNNKENNIDIASTKEGFLDNLKFTSKIVFVIVLFLFLILFIKYFS